MYFQRAGRERERAAGEQRVQEVREGAVAWQAAAAREMEAQEKEKLREETAARVAQAEAAAARAMEEAEAHAREMAAAKRAAEEQAERDARAVEEAGYHLVLALNTHCHADHVTGTGALKRKLPRLRSAIPAAAGAKAGVLLLQPRALHSAHFLP